MESGVGGRSRSSEAIWSDDFCALQKRGRVLGCARRKGKIGFAVLFVLLKTKGQAFAKLNGCYEHLGSGNFSEAMTSLTGEGSEAFALSPALNDTDDFWHRLEYFVEEAFLMGCSIEGLSSFCLGMLAECFFPVFLQELASTITDVVFSPDTHTESFLVVSLVEIEFVCFKSSILGA